MKLDAAFSRTISSTMLWTGVVALLVGLKLVGSYFVPALRTRGEMLWSGALLLIYTARILSLRAEFERRVREAGGQ
jgi:hypothetical protein